MEWKLFDGSVAGVSTLAFHANRERAPHLEQGVHRPRLDTAYQFILRAMREIFEGPTQLGPVKVVDLGCGDGGLLSLLNAHTVEIAAIGYDFQPSNRAGWIERQVYAYDLDIVSQWYAVMGAQVYVITECLEHLTDPHQMVRQIRARNAWIVASSPWTEHDGSHDECHAWAWDMEGYASMIRDVGYRIVEHVKVGMFQVILGEPQ